MKSCLKDHALEGGLHFTDGINPDTVSQSACFVWVKSKDKAVWNRLESLCPAKPTCQAISSSLATAYSQGLQYSRILLFCTRWRAKGNFFKALSPVFRNRFLLACHWLPVNFGPHLHSKFTVPSSGTFKHTSFENSCLNWKKQSYVHVAPQMA